MADPMESSEDQFPIVAEARRYNVERSCIRCHRRKIRCDKSTPCSTCIRSDNAECCRYPAAERVKRRSRTQLATRHVSVDDVAKQTIRVDRNTRGHRRSSSENNRRDSSSKFTGLLIKDGNLVRYVNDRVLSHILEKEEEIRYAMTSTPKPSRVDIPAARPLTLLHSIGRTSYSQELDELFPTQRRAIQLWQLFTLNVDPIIKLLHIPSMQSIVYAAITEPSHVSPGLCALLFAIYFSALNSAWRSTSSNASEDHRAELEQFKHGLEISLSQGDFLDQPNMYSLQAMTIFVGAFRSFGSGRSIWTINGTVIRAAQLMGIHRDGKIFNLSPFDQEMRRRLWWRIISTDSRTLEDQGVWITGNQELGDARMPLNIDDRDIGPSTTNTPQERTGFTEATPLVSICHIQVAGEAVAQLSLCADLESYMQKLPPTLEVIAQTRKELNTRFFQDFDPHIPIQRLYGKGTKMILDKLEWRCHEGLLRHQQSDSTSREEKAISDSDELFTRACDLLDVSLELISNEIYGSFAWHSSSYLPYELLTFVLWRLYVSPAGTSADKAWKIVLRTFATVEEDSVLPDKGPRWAILCKLKEKVGSLRASGKDRVEEVGLPNMSPIVARNEEQSPRGDVLLNMTTWDAENLLFATDWASFQQSLNIDGAMWP